MERQQVAVADRTLVELARVATRVNRVDSEEVDGRVEGAVRGLLGGLERVMKMADCVRLKTLKGLLEVLTPVQCVGFLAAKSMLQLQMRRLGKRRESNGL
ncbi:Protein DOG1-like [Actinidia chinensis var. chinensis]|uniref:Protein DOG1-like n=1 Tax=Actinidia chinensis var. chinensis TaxID=1590841 RepID=A0A2R6RGA8_ACTCC|nr:Protein DOG1-like [Actinidia chinensis var. chinensis]